MAGQLNDTAKEIAIQHHGTQNLNKEQDKRELSNICLRLGLCAQCLNILISVCGSTCTLPKSLILTQLQRLQRMPCHNLTQQWQPKYFQNTPSTQPSCSCQAKDLMVFLQPIKSNQNSINRNSTADSKNLRSVAHLKFGLCQHRAQSAA